MLVTVDMPHENVGNFNEMLCQQQIEVQGLEPFGPAGGNSRYRLLVDSKEAMLALAEFYWGTA